MPTRRYGGYEASINEPHATFQSKLQWAFTGTSGLVFFLWNYAIRLNDRSLLNYLSSNFLLDFRNLRSGRWWTYLTSAVSHQSLNHLLPNLLAFNNYVPLALRFGLKPLELVVLSVGSAIAGSAACVAYWKHEGIYYTSALGASGLIWGLGMTVTLLRPQTMVLCPPVPREIPLWMFTLGCFSLDFFGLGTKSSRIGHAAHIGGMAYGAAFYLIRKQLKETKSQ